MTTESTQPIELPPELSAIEAKLASMRPETEPTRKEQAKTTVLLESCQLAQQGVMTFSREKLVETIVRSGEPEITLSLQQYTKSLRIHSVLNGILLGILVGGLLGIVGGFAISYYFQKTDPQPQPVIQHHYYQHIFEDRNR